MFDQNFDFWQISIFGKISIFDQNFDLRFYDHNLNF